MKEALKATDFDFEYTGSNYSEQDILDKGFLQLTGKELQSKISNTRVFGNYPMGYKFVTEIYSNGKAEGLNDVGSQDFGNWTINHEKNTLQLEWEYGWFNTVTRAYDVNGTIQFYDVETGNWRTTFLRFSKIGEKNN